MSTGFPDADARDDFLRVRRQRVLSQLRLRLSGRDGDLDQILPFEEVVRALGRLGERNLGLQIIPLDSIVGTVDRGREFDRRFRPTSNRPRERWERIAAAMRRGEILPPIEVYRVGELHFVKDGHHRVSVAGALGRDTIDAYVNEIITREPASVGTVMADLPVKDHRRVFRERVPLPPEDMARIELRDPWDYSLLGEGIEAWGFRLSQEHGDLLERATVAKRWFEEEYLPVVEMLREAELIGDQTETEAYLRLSAERYRLLRTHVWTEEVIDRLRHQRGSRG
ncbi:MAG: chromosome partitioning protein ParB [Actinomycetota bacterium]|nr:chromosome partitioning protein ParB [Actinomycetota bacterium]